MTARVATNEMQGILQGALEFTDGLPFNDPWSYCDGNQNRMFKSEMEKGMKPAGKCCRCSVFLFIFFFLGKEMVEGFVFPWTTWKAKNYVPVNNMESQKRLMSPLKTSNSI